MQAIGYKEFVDVLQNDAPLELAVEEVKKGSRHYAKRQLTWFRRNKNIHWLTRGPEAPEILETARRLLREFDN